jgi:hypothetical protein
MAATVLAAGVTIPLTTLVARADVGDLDSGSAAAAAACGSIGVGASSPGGAGGTGGTQGGNGGNAAASGLACAADAAPAVDLSGGGDFFGDQVNIGDRSGGDTTIEGDAFETSVDCSVSATIAGDNQSSTGNGAGALAPESSDCLRRQAINSDGANSTSSTAREESGDFGS